MKKILLQTAIIIAITSSANAQEKMRDWSLSVEETNKQLANPPVQEKPSAPLGGGSNPKNTEGDTGFAPNIGLDPNLEKQYRDVNAKNAKREQELKEKEMIEEHGFGMFPPPNRGGNKKSFISGFCSESYKQTGNSESCQETMRQEACSRFGRATVNVQRLLSQAIDCEASATGLARADCDGLDASRLDLLKQYWQDEDISYTILFLPEMVLNSAEGCIARNGVVQ